MTELQQYAINVVLLAGLVLSALWTVMATRLLRAVVGLALTSATVTALMFMLNAPVAAVFELSVCAGLIPAIFLSTISVTRRIAPGAILDRTRQQMRRYWALPIILVLTGVALSQFHLPAIAVKAAAVGQADVRTVLWNLRHLDLLGQIIILLGGAFGVVVLLKESKRG